MSRTHITLCHTCLTQGVYAKAGKELPADPWKQLEMGVDAVFASWNIPRAVKYREINKITGLKGTAVNVQSMGEAGCKLGLFDGVCFGNLRGRVRPAVWLWACSCGGVGFEVFEVTVVGGWVGVG